MDVDTDLFVQAFWAKCTETIRPELDLMVSALRDRGHEVGVSSQDYSAGERSPAEADPSLTLSLGAGPSLRFRGNVERKVVEVVGSTGPDRSFELADLDLAKVKSLLADWLSKLP